MSVRWIWRPIDRWPREQTENRQRSDFREQKVVDNGRGGQYRTRGAEIGWDRTQVELEREVAYLGAKEAVIQLALSDRDIRVDGEIKLNARLRHPGVVLTITAPAKGVLTFACDRWTSWQANLRGITKGLEALRMLERYGIVSNNEQYTGWRELPSGIPLGARPDELDRMSVEEAGRMVVGWVSGAHDLTINARTAVEDADFRRYAYRQAVKAVHPDGGGATSDGFLRLQRAMRVLEENDDAVRSAGQ